MKYTSTRNNSKEFNFSEVFIKGLAEDGGLFIPKTVPKLSNEELQRFGKLNYQDLAKEIIFLFCNETIKKNELSNIIDKSYLKFREKNVVKIVNVGKNKLLELFHGPTLAFKDIAMQFIGNLYDYQLKNTEKKINVVVATSGDTGAAAINAIKSKEKMNIFVLHPNNKVSSIQRKLMTTTKDKNVFNIAIEGNFDDCQNLVKSMFADSKFSSSINMSGVNSINWARIIAQTVYYFFSYFKICKLNEKINFSVPTGNFGDVYAGYLSKKMGLPINKLIVATNENDILHRAISKGQYEANLVVETLSPSMDIQVASNFERLIYDINEQSADKTNKIMQEINNKKKYLIEKKELIKIKEDFLSETASEEKLLICIKQVYENYKIIIDPHTAVGLSALEKINLNGKNVVLSTAHPCKFPEAINKAINVKSQLPAELKYILDDKENFVVIQNDIEEVKKYILNKLI
ncbi:MAG TPA: threonine synthase [Candidatus Pelagibacter bacterium]|jgi:threonine synthase|nr:threonine synthase [Pelagibacteraceae bacterium]HJN84072.1 threonine synthase [Candidatus Pelagibacter bacterium]|tara:strand:+ start:1127 stop:2509 length:1383 start_codon:yes stop_codon:yes gene_type:complete